MLKIVTPPAIEPVSLAEIESYLRLDISTDSAENAFRTGLIVTAREYCEGYQRRVYITQTLEMTLDKFPSGVINVPRGNLQSIVSIKWKDSLGIEHPLTVETDYIYSTSGILGRIAPVNSWPSGSLYGLDPIKIQFICGYGLTASSVPLRVRQAIYMLVSYWYDNRTAAGTVNKEMEFSVKALLNLDRIAVV